MTLEEELIDCLEILFRELSQDVEICDFFIFVEKKKPHINAIDLACSKVIKNLSPSEKRWLDNNYEKIICNKFICSNIYDCPFLTPITYVCALRSFLKNQEIRCDS